MFRYALSLLFMLMLVSADLWAVNETYAHALKLVHDKSYAEAAKLFRKQLLVIDDQPVLRNRARMWLALTLLADDAQSREAEYLMTKVLSRGLSNEDKIGVLKAIADNSGNYMRSLANSFDSANISDDLQQKLNTAFCQNLTASAGNQPFGDCASESHLDFAGQIDADIIVSAAASLGTMQWRKGKYASAVKLFGIAMKIADNPTLQDQNAAPIIGYLDSSGANSTDQAVLTEQMTQAMLQKQLMNRLMKQGVPESGEILDPETKQQLVQSAMREMFAKQQQEVAQNAGISIGSEGVATDAATLQETARRSSLQRSVATVAKAACQTPGIEKKIASSMLARMDKLSQEGWDTSAAKAQLEQIEKAGVTDCSAEGLAKWGVVPNKSAEQRKAERRAKRESMRAKQRLASELTREQEYFYYLAATAMCVYQDAPSVTDVSNVEAISRQAIAGSLEAGRGNYLQSFQISQRPVLEKLNEFLEYKEALGIRPGQIDYSDPVRSFFLMKLSLCPEMVDMTISFSRALEVMLARSQISDKQIKYLVKTSQRLRRANREYFPDEATQNGVEHWVLGKFYLQTNQPGKALPELQQAISGFKINPAYAEMPEVLYGNVVMAATVLKSAVAAAEAVSDKPDWITVALREIHQQATEAHRLVEAELSKSAEAKTTDNAQEAKRRLIEITESPKMQEIYQQADDIFTKMGGVGDENNPAVQLRKIPHMLKSGELDGLIGESAETYSKPSELQFDIFGTMLEKRYQQYNYHMQLMLQIAQIEMLLGDHNSANVQLSAIDNYMHAHEGWIAQRTRAYWQYTRAKLDVAQGRVPEACKAFSAAVKGWYFNPHSMMDMANPPLEYNAEILEHAAAFAIEQGHYGDAFAYLEIARDAEWDAGRLYGAYSEQERNEKIGLLKEKAKRLEVNAKAEAAKRGELAEFTAALQSAESTLRNSNRDRLSPAYAHLTSLEPIAQWIDSEEIGRFVESAQNLIRHDQNERLRQERIEFISSQVGVKKARDGKHSSIDLPGTLSLAEDIQATIPDDSLLLSIWMGRAQSHVVAVDNQDLRARSIPSDLLYNLVNSFSFRKGLLPVQGKKLYQQILGPFLDRPYKRLILITNGSLRSTPFAALPTESDGHAWLGDDYLIRTLPRAAYLLKPHHKPSMSQKMLLLDGSNIPSQDALPNAQREISTIIKLFETSHIKPNELTRERVSQLLPQYRLVHFAGHSTVNVNFPDYSSLELNQQKLYLKQLEQLPLEGVQMMVLSSCKSASSASPSVGIDFSAIRDSLHNAGVESVVATITFVPDKPTSHLMSRYYQLLKGGAAKDEALQGAQQYLRSLRKEYEDPVIWSAYVLSGSETAIESL